MNAPSESPAEPDEIGSENAVGSKQLSSNPVSELTSINDDTNTVIGGITESATTKQIVEVGGKVGKYEIRSRLGAGGMGAIFLAFDPLIEREVALKVLSPNLHSSPQALQRFLVEARAIGRLNHTHVVSVYDIDVWNDQYFLVMELISGGSVADRVEQGCVPWEEACRIVAEAARGLAAAHEAGIIHRDIKPENLMLTKDGAVKVVDFGLSKLQDAAQDSHTAMTTVGQILGTPQYMSPEQFEAGEVDARTDVYSLGGTLFRLLTARFPYHDCKTILQVMSAHTTKPAPIPSQFDSSIPSAIDSVIAKAMAKKPGDRFASMIQLAEELEALLRNESRSVSKDSPSDGLSDRPLRSVLIVEPSKLQGAVLKDAFVQAGVSQVQLVASLELARNTISAGTPDLLLTAMQLSDGQGVDFLREVCRGAQMSNSSVVLNSSDVTPEELAGVGSAACLMQAPKKVRADDILHVAHATGPTILTSGPLSQPIDLAAVRLQIVLDSGRIPDVLADLLREMQLLDVELMVNPHEVSLVDPLPSLVLLVRRTEVPGGVAGLVGLTRLTGESAPLTAVVQLDQGRLMLRAVRRQGIVAICQRPLDQTRMTCLFQGNRS